METVAWTNLEAVGDQVIKAEWPDAGQPRPSLHPN